MPRSIIIERTSNTIKKSRADNSPKVHRALFTLSLALACRFCFAADVAMGASLNSVLDDLEGGTNRNQFMGHWYYYAYVSRCDKLNINNTEVVRDSQLVFEGAYGGGRAGSKHAAVLDYSFGYGNPLCHEKGMVAGVGTELHPGADEGQDLDLSGATKITMWMKASSAEMVVRVEAVTSDILDYGFFRSEIEVSTEWKLYTVDFADKKKFYQPAWSKSVGPFCKTKARKIQWSISTEHAANPSKGKLWIDDIMIHGYQWTSLKTSAVTAIDQNRKPEPKKRQHQIYIYQKDRRVRVLFPLQGHTGPVQVMNIAGKRIRLSRFPPGKSGKKPLSIE